MGIIDLSTKTGVLKIMRVNGPAKNKPLLWVPGKWSLKSIKPAREHEYKCNISLCKAKI